MRVTRSAEGANREKGLHLLVSFLNYGFQDTAKKGGQHPFRERWSIAFSEKQLMVLQRKLADELKPIMENQNVHQNLKTLVKTIKDLNIETGWRVRTDADFRIRKGKGLLRRYLTFRADHPPNELYDIILSAFANGSFSFLRNCPWCKKFFIAKDLKRMFCSEGCKVNFHNRCRLEDGYFRKRRADMKEKLEKQREKKEREGQKQMEARKFNAFLKLVRRNPAPGTRIAVFIKKRISWNTVEGWLKEMKNGKSAIQIWEGLLDQIKNLFRKYWEEQTSLGV